MQQKCSRTWPQVARTHGSGDREQCPGSRPPAKAERGMPQPGARCHGTLSEAHVGTPGLGVHRDLLCHTLQPPTSWRCSPPGTDPPRGEPRALCWSWGGPGIPVGAAVGTARLSHQWVDWELLPVLARDAPALSMSQTLLPQHC